MKILICTLLAAVASAQLMESEGNTALQVFYHNCDNYDNDHLGLPVCGDDGRTYRNPIYLTCLNYKLKRKPPVRIVSFGSCPGKNDKTGCPWSPFFDPVCGSDGKTYVNEERLICVANQTKEKITVVKKGECEVEDPCCKDEGKSPGPKVCGTNGLTYPSSRAVRCLNKYGSAVDIKHEGGCSVPEVAELYPSRQNVCILSRHHYEFNPVCGTNNVTYLNPFIFLCFSPLGEAVFSGGECECPAHDACKKAIKLDEKLEECKKEVKLYEVCGSDGLTYRSKDHLLCAAKNNTLLTLLHVGRCRREDSPCIRARTIKGFPVCGTDGVTYSSHLALFCIARIRDPSVRVRYTGPCMRIKNKPFNVLSLALDANIL